MRKKLVLHIGAHKTASSLLQVALRENQGALLQNDFRVIFRSQMVNKPFQEEIHRISRGDAGSGKLMNELISDVLPKKKGLNCLITNEDLFSSIRIDDFYFNIKNCLSAVRDAAVGWDVSVIFYVRNQPDYIESVYTQYIHLGRYIDFEKFCGDGKFEYLSWYRVVEDIVSVIGHDKVTVKPFETIKLISADEFFKDFLASSGIDTKSAKIVWPSELETSRGANRSYSKLAIEMAKRVNPLLDKNEKRLFRKFLQENFSTATHEKAYFLTPEERNHIIDIHSESNFKLFDKFVNEVDGKELGYF